jgi:hypothetical protein
VVVVLRSTVVVVDDVVDVGSVLVDVPLRLTVDAVDLNVPHGKLTFCGFPHWIVIEPVKPT